MKTFAVAAFTWCRASTAGSKIAETLAAKPVSSNRRTGTRSPTPSTRDRHSVVRPRAVTLVALIAALVDRGSPASRRSRVASRTVIVSPHHSTASPRDRPSRSVSLPQRLTGSLLRLGHRRIALSDRDHDPLGQVDHTTLPLLALAPPPLGNLPRRTPRLLLDRLLTHSVPTRVEMDSDSHLPHFRDPERSPNRRNLKPAPSTHSAHPSESDAPAVTRPSASPQISATDQVPHTSCIQEYESSDETRTGTAPPPGKLDLLLPVPLLARGGRGFENGCFPAVDRGWRRRSIGA